MSTKFVRHWFLLRSFIISLSLNFAIFWNRTTPGHYNLTEVSCSKIDIFIIYTCCILLLYEKLNTVLASNVQRLRSVTVHQRNLWAANKA